MKAFEENVVSISSAIGFATRLPGCRRGAAMLEFALVAPVFVLLLLGIVQIGQHILANQRLNTASAQLGDLITQETDLTEAKIASLFDALVPLIGSDGFGEDGVVVISGIGGERNGVRRVLWQERGGGRMKEPSRIGLPGAVAKLPPEFTLAEGQTVVAVEVFQQQHALIDLVPSNDLLVKTTVHRGRNGELAEVAPDPCKNGKSGAGNNGNCGDTDNEGNIGKN